MSSPRATDPSPSIREDQLRLAINAVFRSFNTPRARYYRKSQGIPDNTGTAVNIQAMVFGNMGDTSATGVCFTRDPKNGEKIFFGEWLPNAQGEDVVAGTHTPGPLTADQKGAEGVPLNQAMPEVYAELDRIQKILESHFKDMQDIEFTVEDNHLYLLQTRTRKRTPAAAVQIAVDMVNEGLIDIDEAIGRIDPASLELVLRPMLDPDAKKKVIARGLDASPGAATGRVVFHSDEAQELAERGERSFWFGWRPAPRISRA